VAGIRQSTIPAAAAKRILRKIIRSPHAIRRERPGDILFRRLPAPHAAAQGGSI
jgi:hypothetical protein